MSTARGPFSLTINHESGLLVHGFDQPHTARTNHSPPHYAAHIEALGYRKAMDLVAYAAASPTASLVRACPRSRRRGASGRKSSSIAVLRNWNRDFARVLALYNDAWSDNEWATPVGPEEARFIAQCELPACKPGWIRIAVYNGEDIAVAVQIPDANEALRGLHGKLAPPRFREVSLAHPRFRHQKDARADGRRRQEVAEYEDLRDWP